MIDFTRNYKVTVDGVYVGTYRRPDPSGASHARTPVWIFKSWDGEVAQSRTRRGLEDAATTAFARARGRKERAEALMVPQ